MGPSNSKGAITAAIPRHTACSQLVLATLAFSLAGKDNNEMVLGSL
jgi:hypothetical protein